MEIRQKRKEIDIRPASYLDENAENTEKYYLSLKCTKICCSTASDMSSFILQFVSNYILKKFDPLKHETVLLAISHYYVLLVVLIQQWRTAAKNLI